MPALLRAWEPWLPWRAAVRNALAMETLYVEGQALGLTIEELARLEALAAQRALLAAMRSELDRYRASGELPPAPSLMVEHVAVVSAHLRRTGRLALIEAFSWMGRRA